MASLLLRKTLCLNQLRTIHRSAVAFSVPITFNVYQNRRKFDEVLPEVMDTLMTSPKFTQQLPEVGEWVKKLLTYTMHGGKRGRGLSVPFAYQKLEDPEYFTEDKLHTARFIGWGIEMLQASILAVDDVIDASTTRRGQTCWYLQPDVGTSAVNDCLLIFHCLMELIDIKFGKEPIYSDLVKLFNEGFMYTTIGQYLDYVSGYSKAKNNLHTFTMERFNAVAVKKTGYYSFKLPLFAALLLVKNGKERDITELGSICYEFGKILQFQNDYKDLYWDEARSGKAGTDIQEGKLTWIAVTALERCNEAQRSIFEEYYGSKDPEHVKRIKQLYEELQIEEAFESNLSILQLFDYTLEGGKRGKGLAVPFAYQKMEDPQHFTEEKLHSARFLGWCIEMLHGSLLAADDIIDGSTTRRGKPCWYLQPDVGSYAINDCLLMNHSILELVEIKYGNEPLYTDFVKINNESVLYTTFGEYLDHSLRYSKEKNNLDGFTMDRFNTIAAHKTGCSFRSAVLVGLLLVKDGKERDITELSNICLEFGKLLQFQNDYKDIYWDEDSSGKAGTDIQEGKVSWLAVTALERSNEAQRSIFKEYYGSKDPEHVKRIKQLYDELKIEEVYQKFKNSYYESLEHRIRALPREGETEFFLEILEACRKQIF
ncbi:hypothetical protein PYW07_005783 [Mythimna separata]|uniref:Uncharacterized protein n=1 Tax=Mythimna separata TaxID=271217 RepID=A0AAD8DR02_MYTSE|nr:hypothetical protein PYW07_005783 [Mythimna separata]